MIERLQFVGVTGAPLAAVFHPPHPTDPDTGVRGSLLVVHCFTCSKDLNIMSRLARGLAGAGFAVLRFDFTGLGESGGDFSATTLSTNLGDLAQAVARLRNAPRDRSGWSGTASAAPPACWPPASWR